MSYRKMLIATALLLGIASPSLAGRLQDQAQKTEPILLAPPISKAPTGDYNVLSTPGDAAQADASAVPGANARRLAQIQPNDPSKPAQPFGYRNPKPLIQIEPKMVIDQKNREAFADGGDVLLANGNRIPLPGGFPLPTTGLWSRILDIPEGTKVEGPVPAPDLAPAGAAPAEAAPAMAPAPAAAAVPANPLSFLLQGIAKVGDALEGRNNNNGRKLLEGQEDLLRRL